MKTAPIDISRRNLLVGAAGLVIGIALPATAARAQAAGNLGAKAPEALEGTQTEKSVPPNAYVRIGVDNKVTVVVKHLEMGQGTYTGLATLVAEELDADWADVEAVSAPVNAALYTNSVWGGQLTGGSSGMASSFDLMRRAGATARAMLVEAAARRWDVQADELQVEKSVISHPPSNRSARLGAFVEDAAKLPAPDYVTLKAPSAFTLIGQKGFSKRVDIPDKVNGRAIYALDIHEPGLLTVVVARPPRFGSVPGAVDASRALAVKDVVAVRQIPTGFAVYARGTWPAIKGRLALAATWDDHAAETRGSEEMIADAAELTKTPGAVVGTKGDAEQALAQASEIIDVTYVFPFLAHGPMEPLDGYLRWDQNGAHARYGCQLQVGDQPTIAKVLGLNPNQVTIDTMIAGGSFGRRVQTQFAGELAEVAKAIGPGQPVKLVWTREDDIQGGYYRPMAVHRFRATINNGAIIAWASNIASQPVVKAPPSRFRYGVDPLISEGADELLYDIPNFRCDVHSLSGTVTTNSWRSVGHSHTCYAVECFVDLLLEKAEKDPVEGRLALMPPSSRAAGVLTAVAKLAGWMGSGPVNGKARGVAVVEAFGSFVAQIAEVSLDRHGNPKVHKVWCAIDCGIAVNPDIIRAQLESGIGYGMGHILYGDIPIEAGAVKVSNFDDYRALSMSEMPEVEVVIIPSSQQPTGVGELGVPTIGPAIANALARLSGKRQSRLPLVRAS